MNGDHLNGNQRKPFQNLLNAEITEAGGYLKRPEAYNGCVGITMFDFPSSKDNLISVLVPKENLSELPNQALVRIGDEQLKDIHDGRVYQGIVVEGPFYEPDGLRADSSVLITTAVNGQTFMPKYHGRVMVEIIGELLEDALVPPRFRPLPNSPVFALKSEETAKVLNLDGEITLGLAIGHDDIEVKIPANMKSVLPRHLGILGTTGGGKSTTVSGLINHFQENEIATVVLDTEGEYTAISSPSDDNNMNKVLKRRGIDAKGVDNVHIYHLIGRETTNPNYPKERTHAFSISFDSISPYAMMEVLDFNEAQQDRYLQAYDVARSVLREFGLFPINDVDHARLIELDDLIEGYPKLTLSIMYDVVRSLAQRAEKELDGLSLPFPLRTSALSSDTPKFIEIIKRADRPKSAASWRTIQGRLGQLLRLKIFDDPKYQNFDFNLLTIPGTVSIIDLSDTDSVMIRNLAIAFLLKGLMEKQDSNYRIAREKLGAPVNKVMVIIEEAHEFLSSQRIKQMPTLYDQVARIAKRGRKRWLGLTFVTQLPQHLPDEVLALVNNFILHKVSDSNVITRLKRSIGGVDDSLWNKLTGLSSGQAVVSFTHLKRGMLVAVDPTPCKLLMVD